MVYIANIEQHFLLNDYLRPLHLHLKILAHLLISHNIFIIHLYLWFLLQINHHPLKAIDFFKEMLFPFFQHLKLLLQKLKKSFLFIFL
jgi:hypothetical protein